MHPSLIAELQHRGGVQLPEHIDKWTNHIIKQAYQAVNQNKERLGDLVQKAGVVLHAEVFNAHFAQAFVSVSDANSQPREALIGISHGFLYNAACLICFALSRNDLLVEVGRIELESPPECPRSLPSSMYNVGILPPMPKCAVRRAFSALLLSNFAANTFFHEFNHFANGHLGYVGNRRDFCWIEEAEHIGEISPLTKQALEFDADCSAIFDSYCRLLELRVRAKNIDSKNDVATCEALRQLVLPPVDSLKYLFMAMYLPLRMLARVDWDPFDQQVRTHPTPPIRMNFIVFLFETVIIPSEIEESGSTISASLVGEWARECESIYMAVQGQSINPSAILSTLGPASEYQAAIESELERLRPLLAPHVLKTLVDDNSVGRV